MTPIVTKIAASVTGALALLVANAGVDASPRPPSPVSSAVRMPVYFELNRGQSAPDVKFVARGLGYRLLLSSTEAIATMPSATRPLRLTFIGANTSPSVIGLDELSGKANYLLGAVPASWRTNIPLFASVLYRDLYPGIDLVYHANQQQLEYDFIVAPGADPGAIALGVDGAQGIELTPDGDLLLRTESGTLRHAKPVVYQQVDGDRRTIQGRCILRGPRQVGFELGPYDASRPLVIDPTLAFSSYLGGSGSDMAQRVAIDAARNIYFTGRTGSQDFPVANAVPRSPGNSQGDAFVVKVSADGSTLLYATYFGGTGGDEGLDIGVDAAGDVYIAGITSSADFPTHNAIQPVYGGSQDAFVVRLNVSGDAFVYATYLGGNDHDRAAGIAVDALGNAYVGGSTSSRDFPTEHPFQPQLRGLSDAFITKLGPTGTLVYSTYLGGSNKEQVDFVNGIAVNAAGNAYVAGTTSSKNFPTRQAVQRALAGESDAFVTKLSVEGDRLVYSTFLGGTSSEIGIDITVNDADRATIVGHTFSTDFPTANALQGQSSGFEDVFVAQFDPDGALRFSTYLGGTNNDFPESVGLDPAGNVYITGFTNSADFPLANPIQSIYGGGTSDAFVTKLSADGAHLVYSTYLGGNDTDDGVGITADSDGNAYVTGTTRSFDFPVVNALQPTHAGVFDPFRTNPDAFFVKIVP
jgi:Beta-propeller repeat